MYRIKGYSPASTGPLDLVRLSYHYHLPEELIAERAVSDRHSSRLLIYDQNTNQVTHTTFFNLDQYLPHNTTLVFNQSKVFPSRLKAQKKTGGKAEVFLLTYTPNENNEYRALVKYRGKKNLGDILEVLFNEAVVGELSITRRDPNDESVFFVRFHDLENPFQFAKLPIPPYIRNGESDEQDLEQYQTTYAKSVGSVAASTAGLHFSHDLREKLKAKGITESFVTLHVGLGTFKPVTVQDLKEHQMHTEPFMIDEVNHELIKKAQYRVAVGTTSLRTLESIVGLELENKTFHPGQFYETNIFLHPGKDVESIDALITNFHLPESTLIMLVSAILGREKTLELYNIAVENKYRFFSYGDAMLIIRKKDKNEIHI